MSYENVYLDPEVKPYFSPSQAIFDQLMALCGECYRHQKARRTQRIILGKKTYFIKQHGGIGWKEIVKDLCQFRFPILSAKNEKLAIDKLQALGVPVPVIAGYGQRGMDPARKKSFILLEEIAPVISLEELTKTWVKSSPTVAFKHKIIVEVARIARILHQNGINHRDFYLCHFLLDTSNSLRYKENSERGRSDLNDVPEVKLYLIDLHRAQIRHLTPRRWVIKDLSGLYFSSKDIGLTQRDVYRFMKAYAAIPLRQLLQLDETFWQKVRKRGERLYSDHTKRK